MTCDARIRPFPPRLAQPDVEIACAMGDPPKHGPNSHSGVLRDYAYPGSETVISWEEGDRRTYHGDWPGACGRIAGCLLPAGHHRDCAT
jgi:hypothetical protein